MNDDLEYIIMVIGLILAIFGGIFLGFYTTIQEQKQTEQIYNLLMANKLEFIDSYIDTGTSKGTYYKIVYRENGEIKESKMTLQQYYNIIEKYQKTIDK